MQRASPDRAQQCGYRLARRMLLPAWTSSRSASWPFSSRYRGASWRSVSASEEVQTVSLIYIGGGFIAVVLLVYLFVALLAPERF